ncbi:disrupted in renal carcinoma protein 2 homolog [Acanthaster planci]|uniref:Disrupted in renal carcinoma protein 2 homolog n=1 Tax=Acanthaster planci TaxID=133434 RepID=A0A8B7Z6F2_ACAPL|nr:disrupted in renal carcinoma protein 2 homolog [Acanthaster planci]
MTEDWGRQSDTKPLLSYAQEKGVDFPPVPINAPVCVMTNADSPGPIRPPDSDHSLRKRLDGDHDHPPHEHYVAYARRWYILAVFSLLFVLQAAAWNTWGPIADTTEVVLRWTQADLDLCINWGPITYVVTGFVFSYILKVKGLRFAVLCSALLFLFGMGFRCIPVGINNIKWTANVGQVFVGVSAPILQAAPTQLSAVWFPPHQRTTSTAIASTAGYLGLAGSFLIGPNIVTDVPKSVTADNITAESRTQHFNEIMNLLYIECGLAAALVIAALLYFPDRPPTPPSVSAGEQRESFLSGAISLLRNAQFWIPALAYSVSTGLYAGWSTQLDSIFDKSLGVKQDTVGWIGFIGNLAAVAGGLIFARLVDFLGGRMKLILLVMMIGSVGSCVWCVLLSMQYVAFNLPSLYISCIIIGFFVNASIPIYFEVTVEGMYPVSEGTITMIMTWLNNAVVLVFLLLPQIKGIGVTWMNWVFLGSVVFCVPLLLMYKERYKRLNLDTKDE